MFLVVTTTRFIYKVHGSHAKTVVIYFLVFLKINYPKSPVGSTKRIFSESEIKKIDDEIKNEINEIVEFAKNSPEPDESELLTEIYN